MHLLRRSFEKPAAAGGKQGIAAKQAVLEKISDVARGVTGNEQDFPFRFPNSDFVILLDAAAETVNPAGVAFVAVNVGLVACQDSFVSAGMVAVMMGVENRAERDAFLLDFMESGFRLGRVDDRGRFGLLTNQ